METDLRAQTTELRTLATALMQRCAAAERRAVELEVKVAGQQERIARLEGELDALSARYHRLQMSLPAGSDPAEVARRREAYLALVREIDECISLLG